MDGHHLQNTIKLFEEAANFSWTLECFFVRLVMRTDGAEIDAAGAMKPSQVPSSSKAIVLKNVLFVDTVKSLINYEGFF